MPNFIDPISPQRLREMRTVEGLSEAQIQSVREHLWDGGYGTPPAGYRRKPMEAGYPSTDSQQSQQTNRLTAERQRLKDEAIVRRRQEEEKKADQARRQRQLPHAVENWRQGMENKLNLGQEFANKEKAIGRKLTDGERGFYSRNGQYPGTYRANQEAAARRLSTDDLMQRWGEGTGTANEFENAELGRRYQEARNRTPLENAIRRWFTPVKNQIPEKYLK